MGIRFLIYFLIGGTVVTLVTYFGSQGKGILAAFVALFPATTVLALCTIYSGGGISAATSYVRGMLLVLPPWAIYGLSVLYLLPRLGLAPSLVIGTLLYIAGGLVMMKLTA